MSETLTQKRLKIRLCVFVCDYRCLRRPEASDSLEGEFRAIVSNLVRCGHWQLNPGPLQEQQVHLTAELSLHPDEIFIETPRNSIRNLSTVRT